MQLTVVDDIGASAYLNGSGQVTYCILRNIEIKALKNQSLVFNLIIIMKYLSFTGGTMNRIIILAKSLVLVCVEKICN